MSSPTGLCGRIPLPISMYDNAARPKAGTPSERAPSCKDSGNLDRYLKRVAVGNARRALGATKTVTVTGSQRSVSRVG